MEHIICFGCGRDAKAFLSIVSQKINIDYFLDNGLRADHGNFCGYDVYRPNEKNCSGKTVVVTTTQFYFSIREQLERYGLKERIHFISVLDFLVEKKDTIEWKSPNLFLRDYKAAEYTLLCQGDFPQRDTLDCKSYKNAVILPLKKSDLGQYSGRGGVIDQFGQYVSGGEFYITDSYECKDAEYRDEKVVYCGYLFMHWGHFLMDMISRCWYFLQKDASVDRYIFITDSGVSDMCPDGQIKDFFRLLGMEEKIEMIGSPVSYREVIIPERSYQCGRYYSRQYREVLSHAAAQAAGEMQGKNVPVYKKIFLTCTQFYKKAIGIEPVNDFFERNGYKIINPSDFTLTQKIYMLQNAEHIAAQSGSWAHDLLFAKEGCQVIIVERFGMNNSYQFDINRMMHFNAIHIDANLQFWPITSGEGPHMFYQSRHFCEFVRREGFCPPAETFLEKAYVSRILKQYLRHCSEIRFRGGWTKVYEEAFCESVSEIKEVLANENPPGR